jgi:hypothetical protein
VSSLQRKEHETLKEKRESPERDALLKAFLSGGFHFIRGIPVVLS